jgi:hypothetical protein
MTYNVAKVIHVLQKLSRERITAEIVSPNYVADFAGNRNIDLTSTEVVIISNTYEGPYDKTIGHTTQYSR